MGGGGGGDWVRRRVRYELPAEAPPMTMRAEQILGPPQISDLEAERWSETAALHPATKKEG